MYFVIFNHFTNNQKKDGADEMKEKSFQIFAYQLHPLT